MRAGLAMRCLAPVLGLAAMLAAGHARADSCTASMTDVLFTPVSPIGGVNVTTTGTATVTCTWTGIAGLAPFLVLFPNVTVCLFLGNGTNSASTTPRQLKYGTQTLNYNLYTDASYAAPKIWGAPVVAATPTPIILTMTKGGSAGTLVQTVTVYGQLTADASLSAARTAGTGSAMYTSDFGAGSAAMQYSFVLGGLPACLAGPVSALPFQVRAEVINDCTISAGALAFPSGSLISSPVRATSSIAVACSPNAAYQISLNGGSVAGSVTARQMQNLASAAAKVSYRLSNSLDGTLWGDGTGGTVTVTGTGDGSTQSVTVYGLVPSQSAVLPGSYKDTVTAVVAF
ncbi:spore coat U domain-containing protein [Duganella sp. HH101]|uniref:Csu type fimbrial protein n=1 Tax=Duganella sp. HH101 TaxID=1781066 RepID=UPI00087401CA|nr:spore coat U domain-containing protein [Duganella sp. HH101]OFA00381.1 spore coat protein U domain protein [Duganella sp. HH101]